MRRTLANAHRRPTDNVTLYGLPTWKVALRPSRSTSTAFPPGRATRLGEAGYAVWEGDYYAVEVMKRLGLEKSGAVRAGIVHYNTADEVDGLLAEIAKL